MVTLGLLEQYLVESIIENDFEGVILRLKQGASVEAHDPDHGKTALHHAVAMNHIEVAEHLLFSGADANSFDFTGKDSLHMACRNSNFEMLQLLTSFDVNVDSKTIDGGWTPLHFAAQYCFNETGDRIATSLVNMCGADASLETELGQTALELCARFNNVSVASVLLDSIPVRPHVLQVACCFGSAQVAALLVDHGYDVFSRPIATARIHGHANLAKTLRNKIEKQVY